MDGYTEFGTTAVAHFLDWRCHISNQSCLKPAIVGQQDDGCNYCSLDSPPLHNQTSPKLPLSCHGLGEHSGNSGLLPLAVCAIVSVTHGEVKSVPISLCTPAPIQLCSGPGGL